MARTKTTESATICHGGRKAAMPQVIRPMLATLVDHPFSDPDWLFETKWDGIRAICFVTDGKARFVSRNQIEITAQYPELARIMDSINAERAILDGEIVALDEQGVSRFQLLQPRLGRKNLTEIERLAAKSRIVYYVFDLLYLDGLDLTGCNLLARKTQLEVILKSAKNVRYSDHLIAEGVELFKEIARVPLEGMVAKCINSTYVEKRSRDWLKIKTIREAEVVIGGYTQPRRSRTCFGSLVVGQYDAGQLLYVAHVGGGFNQRSLEQVYKIMQPLKSNKSPFVVEPQTNEPVQWVRPRLVAQVKFSEWTADARMRHPIFLGLRDDKKAEQCTFEAEHEAKWVVEKKTKFKR
jgi:bifunctional non-homologous end joining protein LigD